MPKQLIRTLGAFALVFGFAVAHVGAPAYAVETETGPTVDETDADPSYPAAVTDTNCIDDDDEGTNCITATEVTEPADDADTAEEDAEELLDDALEAVDDDLLAEELEEDTEPALWPAYLSLGVIGVSVLLIIIINLCGRKK